MKNLKLNFFRKINIGLFLTLLAVLITVKNSGAQWIQQTLPQNGGIILGIEFESRVDGVAGGWNFDPYIPVGLAYYTHDEGVNWQKSAIPDSTRAIVSIKSISNTELLAVGAYNKNSIIGNPKFTNVKIILEEHYSKYGIIGEPNYNGIILKSTDKGNNWLTLGDISQEYNYVTGIEVIDFENIFIFGHKQSGEFFFPVLSRTSNGGKTWNNINVPIDTGDIVSLKCFGNVIYAAGYEVWTVTHKYYTHGVLLRSTDSGVNWSKETFDNVKNFTGINFVNVNTGFASAALQTLRSEIYKTNNSGKSWSILNLNLDSILIRGIAINSETILIYGNKVEGIVPSVIPLEAIVGKSFDYGNNWEMSVILDTGILTNSKFMDSLNIYMSGGKLNDFGFDPIILQTTNGGSVFAGSNGEMLPNNINLFQNYPNPFNPVTVIRYSLFENRFVRLRVFNSLGREVSNLVNEKQSAGSYEVKFDGSGLSSGVYFYRLEAGDFSEVKKMFLVK